MQAVIHRPDVPVGSAGAAAASPATAEGLADGAAAATPASLSASGAAAGAAGALTDAGVEAAAELVGDTGDFLLGVAAAKRSESSSLSGSAWSRTEVSDGDMLTADGLMRGDLHTTLSRHIGHLAEHRHLSLFPGPDSQECWQSQWPGD